MNVEDLMIGDWVSYRGIVNKVAPADFCKKAWIDEIKPIPLTPEILEKNGYHTTPVYDIDDDSIVYPHIDLLGEWTWYDGKIYYSITDEEVVVLFDCKYVHEFQNFLRCVGIKKEIVL